MAQTFTEYAVDPPRVATTLRGRWDRISSLFAIFDVFSDRHPGRYRYLLPLRFAIVNLIGLALFGAAAMEGWIGLALVADTTGLSVAIFGLFVAGLGLAAVKTWRTGRELDFARRPAPPADSRVGRYLAEIAGRDADSRAIAGAALRLKLFGRIAVVRQIAGSLVVLGLIGTVVGFILALSGVDPAAAGDASAVGPMVSTLIQGMSVALYTTLVGAIGNIWLMVAYRVLATGTINLVAALIERGESHARV